MAPLLNLSSAKLTKEEEEAPRLGFSMTWPKPVNPLSVKTETEVTFMNLMSVFQNQNVSKEDSEYVHSKLKSVSHSYLRDQSKIPKSVSQKLKS